jgi:hypothetical protein
MKESNRRILNECPKCKKLTLRQQVSVYVDTFPQEDLERVLKILRKRNVG